MARLHRRIYRRIHQLIHRGPHALALVLLCALGLGACRSAPGYDYGPFLASEPRSILVLPPLNQSPEAEATLACTPILTRPLAEQGYYVFPIAVVDQMMRDNGLPTPVEMHAVPLAKLREVFNPDAVLYVTIADWGSRYQVLSSAATVRIRGLLVDARDGRRIWSGAQAVQRSSGGGSLTSALVNALANQVVNSLSDPSTDLAREASWRLFGNRRDGMLPGPYDPEHAERFEAAASHQTLRPQR